MKIEMGPAFGAVLIAVGLCWLLFTSGQSLLIAVTGGVVAGVLDYVILIWLKAKGLGK